MRSVGTILADGQPLPALVLDARDRPDVADLARVHELEGIGDLRSGLGVFDLGPRRDWLVRFELAVDHPVRCRFHAVLGLDDAAPLLRQAGAAGSIAVGTEPVDESRWLAVHVDPDRLAAVLDGLDDPEGPDAGPGER